MAYSSLSELFTATANAIRSKTGGTEPIVANNFPEEISKIQTESPGGGESGGDDDNFPIGDGNVHIWISLPEGRTSPVLGVAVDGTVIVDWGDGSAPDTLTGTNTTTVLYTPPHQYSRAGDYVITLSGDCQIELKAVSGKSALLSAGTPANNESQVYKCAIKKVETGKMVMSVSYNPFIGCRGLERAVLHSGIAEMTASAFNDCCSLKSVAIPDGVKTMSGGVFQGCSNLTDVAIPDSVTELSGNLFYNCISLSKLAIPPSVAKISNNVFNNCNSVRYFDFTRHTAVPTLGSSGVFSNLATDCEFRVPAALADEWKAATNWANYANYIVGV